MFSLGEVVVTKYRQFSIQHETPIKMGTAGIIYDVVFGGGVDEIFYVVDFDLGSCHCLRAVAREFELSLKKLLLH